MFRICITKYMLNFAGFNVVIGMNQYCGTDSDFNYRLSVQVGQGPMKFGKAIRLLYESHPEYIR